MSSPDPLNESLTSSVARRITRSQQAKHFVSLGNSSSPRKQTFELEVGDNTSPQKLFVTVESGPNTGDARRRLFTSSSSPTKSTPSIRRRERATTTTIPLKGISEVDDDGLDLPAITPRRRGRPPKSAVGSTPKPVALKRRSGTPIRKATPGRPRKSQNQDAEEDLPSETSVATATPRTARGRKATRATSTEPSAVPITQGTPTPKRKTVTKRKTVDDEASSVPPSSARRRGRPRKKPLLEEATQLEATLPTLPESQEGLSVPQNRAVNASLSPMHSEMDIDTPGLPAPASEGDIWMDTLSDGITPRLAPRMRSLNLSSTLDLRKSTASHAETTVASNFEGQADEEAAVATDDFGASLHRDSTPLASRETTAEPETDIDAVDMIVRDHPTSDFPSEASEHGEESNRMPRGDKDTIVQSEEFSMIFMDSIPSLQSSMFGRAPTEVGEETNLLINRTIEAIKNGMDEEEEEVHEEEHEATAAEVGDVEQPKGDIEEDEGNVTVTQETTRNHEMDDEELEDQMVEEEVVEAVEEDVAPPEAEELDQAEQTHQELQHFDDGEITVHEDAVDESDAEILSEVPLAAELQEPASEDSDAEMQQETPTRPRTALSPTKGNGSAGFSGSPRRMKSLPLSRQLLTFKAMQAEQTEANGSPSPVRFSPAGFSRRRSSGVHANEDSNMYEDSFSEIPDAVLEAATPRAPRTTLFPASADGQSEKSYGSHQKAASVASNAPDTVRSDTSRLLTPDETPSPNDVELNNDGSPKDIAPSSVDLGRSVFQSKPSASLFAQPQLFDTTARAPSVGHSKVTPLGLNSSPQLPPLIDANFSKPTVTTERERRTAMSPIVRAGLALQSVTSDHSSPAGRRSVLGSPFKGSAKSSRDSSVAPASEHKSAAKPSPQLPAHMDDPFGPSRSHNGQSSFMKALNNSSRRSSLNQRGPARPSLFDTTRAVVDDADEMSWIAEPTIEAPPPMLAAASRSSSVAGTIGSVDGVEDQAAMEPSVDGSAAGQEGDETEDDIWMMEDEQRSAVPQPTRQDSLGSQEITGTRGLRRTELPNTWRQSAFGRSIATRPPPTRQMGGQERHSLVEDYSLLSQRSKKAEAASSAVDEGQKRAALNLSDFFSSPAVLPPRPGFEDVRVRQINPNQGAGASKSSNNGPMTTQLTNSLFPSVPQKEFQPSPVRKRSLFTSSVQSSRPSESSDTEIQATSSPSVRSELAQPSSVPQKANFTPRRRDAKRTLEGAAPTQSSVGSGVGLFSRRREPEEPVPTSTVSAKSSDAQLNIAPPSFNLFSKPAQAMPKLQGNAPRTTTAPPRSPERYPLHKTMSPTKSCLRSPLKPKTPGRVVEWASSVLSPLQQAEIRTQNQNQQPVLKQPVLKQPQVQQPSIVPTVQFQPPKPSFITHSFDDDKENSEYGGSEYDGSEAVESERAATESLASSSPERKQSSPSKMEVKASNPFPTQLSQAMWSRDHWLYLDGLLQYRREQPFPKDVILPEVRGMCRELLGKRLRSREASMPLQQWHLDVIEAFHSQVGGWSKSDLSTRIFSLILGEKLAAEGRRVGGRTSPGRAAVVN